VLFKGMPPRDAVTNLMTRPEKHEYDAAWVADDI